jgi:hypothetical protein
MESTQKTIAQLAGKGEGKNTPAHSNSLEAQRKRLMDWFRKYYKISTLAARRDLDILSPAARVHELRHKFGIVIDLVWVKEQTDCGKVHRVGMYVYRPESEVCHG